MLLDFYAGWCAPCRKMSPELQSLQQENKDEIVLMTIDADENRLLMDRLKVEAIPALFLIEDGKIIWSHSGLIEKEKDREQLIREF